MTKDNFSDNELEPIGNNDDEVSESSVDFKNVEVDNVNRRNVVGLIILIVVLIVIGFIVFLDMSSEDKQVKEPDYFSDLSKWAITYKEYFVDYSEKINNYEIVFLDLDFDEKAEAIVKYTENNTSTYKVVDLLGEEEVSFTYDNVSDLIMMYSFSLNKVTWYMDTSLENRGVYIVDLTKRLNNDADYELYLDYDALTDFKSDHFNISYRASYTKVSFRSCEKNLAEAILLYEQEKKEINKLADGVIEKYSGVI